MTQNERRRPLAPGEIRRHTVGDQTFKIMHTGNGAFTQATVRQAGVPTTEVLATLPFESAALKIYAAAIERAEATAAPEVDYNLPMGANSALVYGEPVGAVPQRATDADGWGIWLHGCGAAQSAKRGDGICDACGAKTAGTSDWQALYTLGGE
jgi:hypothetical protein